jgi:hypothetical protein
MPPENPGNRRRPRAAGPGRGRRVLATREHSRYRCYRRAADGAPRHLAWSTIPQNNLSLDCAANRISEHEQRDAQRAIGVRTDIPHLARIYNYLLGGCFPLKTH